MKKKILYFFYRVYLLKKNFSLVDAIKIVRSIKNEKEVVILKKDGPLYLRKNSKDTETFEEIYIDLIYNTELHIYPHKIIDAGANVGLAARFFKKKYREAQIVSLEIDASNCEMIHKNNTHNKDVIVLQKALYFKKDYFKITDPFNATNSFTIEQGTKDDHTISSTTVDEIMAEQNWDGVDLLKMDIEGAELEIFQNDVSKWLPQVQVLMIETHDRMRPHCSTIVLQKLDEYGFILYTTTTGGTLVFYSQEMARKISLTS